MNQTNKKNILGYTLEDLKQIAVENNLKPYLAKQLFDWIYKKRVNSFDEMSNISKTNLAFLKENFYFGTLKEVIKQVDPIDETTKFLFELSDGYKIETVLMKFDYGYSVCVTTQVGCNMGCKFCASGLLKKKRDLHASEIVQEIYTVQKYLDEHKPGERVGNIVVMGIGEPLDNFDNVVQFIRIVNDDNGLQIGARKITVSTCGIVNKFDRWIEEMPQVGLAISLHASNNEVRNQIMPINKAFNFDKVLEAAQKYVDKTKRRITFEYIMLRGINDSKEHALELAERLKGMLCYVNLIPYNPVRENDFQRSTRVKEFADTLTKHGITVTTRQEKGSNIDAACGQLRAKNEGIL
ncbi:23S rRNA (adenine(2503)-C(2))-methyltransferase RlmN [Ureaplasma ceti]